MDSILLTPYYWVNRIRALALHFLKETKFFKHTLFIKVDAHLKIIEHKKNGLELFWNK